MRRSSLVPLTLVAVSLIACAEREKPVEPSPTPAVAEAGAADPAVQKVRDPVFMKAFDQRKQLLNGLKEVQAAPSASASSSAK